MIGVLIGDVSFEFTAELMAGISDAAEDAGSHVTFFLGMQKHSPQAGQTGGPSAVSHNSVYDYAMLAGADCFIIACGSLTGFSGEGLDRKFLDRFAAKPYVVLQERVEQDSPKHSYIVVDNYASYMQCMEHLIVDHGYQKIAFVSGPEGHADARERMRAYMDAMQRFGLTVTPEMIVYGDFYEYVDDQVAALMDRNTDLEAIAFANDEMAKAGYRECRRRGLVVGRDVAITGFDNFTFCHSMEPPLTTVSQDAYKMGQHAVEKIIKLSAGKPSRPLVMKTEFIRRQSCGCKRDSFCFVPSADPGALESTVDQAILDIVENYAQQFAHGERNPYLKQIRACFARVRELVLAAPGEPLDQEALLTALDATLGHATQTLPPLAHILEDFLLRILCAELPPQGLAKLGAAVAYMLKYAQAHSMQEMQARLDNFQLQSWIAPDLTRDLYEKNSEEEVFRSVTERLCAAGLTNIYICLLEQPLRYSGLGLAAIPHKLLLAAHASKECAVEVYPRAAMPVIDAARPLMALPGYLQAQSMMAFSFFSGENQYGILLCETDKAKSALLHVIGLQMGMLIDFLELRRKERAIAEELEDIREKNEILNFLSEYDLMCSLLNRRGFIERAIRLNRENIGTRAYCAFIDLDYLKQINDTYGHSEGDVALQGVSSILQHCATERDLLGRIGGDEFVGMYITDDPDFERKLRANLDAEHDRYNERSGKPYILDISVGIASFVCQQGLEVSGVIAEADKYLYEAKRSRTTHALRMRPVT